MAIEIRELHIKAVAGSTSSQQRSETENRSDDDQDRESLIAQCVERVMEVLARQRER